MIASSRKRNRLRNLHHETTSRAKPVAAHERNILERARAAKNGARFSTLYDRGDPDGRTASEDTAALCSMLAFWTQDPDEIDRLFQQGGKGDEARRLMQEALTAARLANNEEQEAEALIALVLSSSSRRGIGDREHYFRELEKKEARLKAPALKTLFYRAKAALLLDQGESAARVLKALSRDFFTGILPFMRRQTSQTCQRSPESGARASRPRITR
jgi:NrS-1  polymerase HBD domain